MNFLTKCLLAAAVGGVTLGISTYLFTLNTVERTMETYLVLGNDLTQHRTGTFSSLTEREKIVSSLVQSIIQQRFLINANTENYDLLLPFVDEGHIPVIINFTDKDFAISDKRLFKFLEERNGTARELSKSRSTEFKNDYALSDFDHGKVLHILKQQPEDLKRLYCTLETFKCLVRNTLIRILKDFLEKDDNKYTFIISLNQFECKECSYLDSANKSFTAQEFVLQYQMGLCDAVLFSCEDLKFIINLNGLHE